MNTYGLGYRPIHYSQVIIERPKVDFFEIISENFMGVGGNPKRKLLELRDLYPIAMHGVSLSIAGDTPFDKTYLSLLKCLMEAIDPFIVSDHLCFTSDMKNRHSYDLLPISYNEANLHHVISRVSEVQDFLGRQITLENPSSYIAWKSTEMHEADFLAQVCRATGAGVLLDLNNLIVNKKNLGIEPKSYLALLKKHVRQFHIAGHKTENGFAIDTHDQPVEDAVWSLLYMAKKEFPNIPILLEWDDNIPSLEELCRELDKARNFNEIISWEIHSSSPEHYKSEAYYLESNRVIEKDSEPKDLHMNINEKEFFFKSIIDYKSSISKRNLDLFSAETPLNPTDGLAIYQSSYYLRIKSALKETCPNLCFIAEDAGLNAITKFYLKFKDQSHWSLNFISESLVDILKKEEVDFDFGVSAELITEITYIDQLINESFLSIDDNAMSHGDLKSMNPADFVEKKFGLTQSTRFFISNWEILPLLEHISSYRKSNYQSTLPQVDKPHPPKIPELARRLIVITRLNNHTRVCSFSAEKFFILNDLKKGISLPELIPSENLEGFKFFINLIELGAVKEIKI